MPRRRRARATADGSTRGEDDVAVLVQAEPGVVRDLPGVPIEIPKRAGVASVKSLGGLARDVGAISTSQLDHLVDLLVRPDVVRQGDPAPARTVVGDAQVGAELLPPPEREDDAVALKERGLVHLERGRPAK